MKQFIKEVIKIHNHHNSSYSEDEGYDLIDACAKHHDTALEWIYSYDLARRMYEDGDSGILQSTMLIALTIEQFILANSVLTMDWEIFDTYISSLMDSDVLYIAFLKQLYKDDPNAFWSDAFMLYDEDCNELFESIICIALNEG